MCICFANFRTKAAPLCAPFSSALCIFGAGSIPMFFLLPVLIILGLSPALLVWVLAAYFSPEAYDIKPLKMLVVSFVLSVVIGMSVNIELEAGMLSGIVFISVASFALSCVLIPLTIIYKYVRLRLAKNA
ncbi:hypothetical protein Sde_1814 [Saccharophagus degradans 2-40]|uniref:Uncharacterized protein n=2 Tax=Saccharophagus degradans TaxID=86304 RepID=Q21JQ5_SACD2|nr:hypothetical protein Sde_1814 [Saccharophagus degradans 2-40]